MSIASEIQRLQQSKAGLKDAIETYFDVSIPASTTLDGYPEYISYPAIDTERPPFLQAGDKVAIVSVSTAGTTEMVTAGQTLLESWGLTVTLDYNVSDPATDRAVTATYLVNALKDTTVKALMCVRGGYGSVMSIPHIPEDIISANPKWLIGYSDVTGYLCEFVHAGVQCIHGPMCTSIVNHPDDDGSLDKLHDILFGVSGFDSLTFTDGNSNNVVGSATGRLVGGNATTLLSYLNGEHSPFTFKDDIILVLEDTGDNRTVDLNNWLYQIKYSTKNRVKAIIVGDLQLTTVSALSGSKYTITKNVFWDIPVAFTSNIGHLDVNWPMVMGSIATLDVTSTSECILSFCQTETTLTVNTEGVTLRGLPSTISIGGSLKAHVTPEGSNGIDSVTILMNNVDVTSTAWTASTRTISLTSITGPVSITISATNAVPEGYTPVDYLLCTGDQRFSTGFKASSSLPYEVTVMCTNTSTLAYNTPFGGRTSTSSLRYDLTIGYLDAYSVPSGAVMFGFRSGATNKSESIPLGKVSLIMEGGVLQVFNNGEHIYNIDRSSTSFTCNYNMYIGAVNNSGTARNNYNGRLYRMTFGSTADFVPAVRNSDDVPGMYDIIRNTFYASGTGTNFGYGND